MAVIKNILARTKLSAKHGLSAACLALASLPGHAMLINATYNANMSSSSIAVVNNAIAFYQSIFADPITVNIAFGDMTTGLGSSLWAAYTEHYSTFSAALAGDATSSDDATANITAAANNPVTGSTTIYAKSANLRAIGINQGPYNFTAADGCSGGLAGAFDGCIGLNLSITDDSVSGGYSLISVVEHEINEVLGLGSGLDISNHFVLPEDLFRWSAVNTRSFSGNAFAASCNYGSGVSAAYFSIDNGATNLNQFNNCDNGGDYGDWITHTPTQVQDAFTNGSGAPFLTASSTEVRALDVIGYTLRTNNVPEPASLAMIFLGLAGIAAVRRRKQASLKVC